MVAFQYRMPAGIPGDINRAEIATVETAVITPNGTTGAPAAYGIGGAIDATTGNFRVVAAGDTFAANFYGFLARPFPTGNSQDALGTSTPPASGICDVMRRGYMTVLLGGSTAAVKGGQVYIWTAASSGAHVQGQVEASDPGGSGFALTGSYFMGPADSNGNVEIALNI